MKNNKNQITSPRLQQVTSNNSRGTEKRRSSKMPSSYVKTSQSDKRNLSLNFNKKISSNEANPAHVNFNVVEIIPKVVLTNRSSSLIITKGSDSNVTNIEKKDSISEVTTINKDRQNEIGTSSL
jgi:hypothetical protein